MKKSILFLGFQVVLFSFSVAQSNTDYYDRMDLIFGAIDQSKVSTGLLKDFGLGFVEIGIYDGTINNDNWIDKNSWHYLYYSLYTMRVGANTVMSDMPTVRDHFDARSTES